jgi:predicted small lipoprotein YifL
MKIQNNKLLISCCFISLLVLAGCGLKGDLYQTPVSAKDKDSLPENRSRVKPNKTTEPAINHKELPETVTPDIEQELK